jgi:hypothetical protein
MDDQFGGRTDDDLFADEFEPVCEEETQVYSEPAPVPVPAANDAPTSASPASSTAPTSVDTGAAQQAHAPTASGPKETASEAAASSTAPANATAPQQKSGLMQSRHAQHAQPPASAPREPRSHRTNNQGHKNHNHAKASPSPSSPALSFSGRHDSRQHKPNPASDARTGSGGNPRTKLTEAELAEKMEKMRILNEEKTRRFKKVEEDEQSHAIAMEKASAEQRKRRQEEAERRRREANDKRQLDDEREKNRQRKLNALGARESNWDEGKEDRLAEEDRRRGSSNFRGANGGIRGSARGRGGGISGSRFADSTPDTKFMSIRGGRDGRKRPGSGGDKSGTPGSKDSVLTPEEFPALPSATGVNKSNERNEKNDSPASGMGHNPPPLSPVGQWDDEMAAMDAKTKA